MNLKITPPLLYQSFIVLMILLHFFLPVKVIITFPYNIFGILLFSWGVWVAIKAKRLFKESNTPIKPTATPVRIIDYGPFRYSRNPMYLGITVGLFGIAVLLGSLSAFCLPVLFFLLMNFIYVSYEEKMLAKVLGEDWKKYKSNVRRWI